VEREALIDMGQEWSAFNQREVNRKVRTGAPSTFLMHDKGLTTMIGRGNRDCMGKKLNPKKMQEIRRLQRWNSRTKTQDSLDRNLNHANLEIDRLGSVMQAPKSVREATAKLYRTVSKKGLVRGRSIEGVVASCLYIIFKKFNIPKTISEIAEKTDIDKKKIGRYYRTLCNELGLNLKATDPMSHLPKYSSELGLSSDCNACAKKIIQATKDYNIAMGKDSRGMCAASIYIAGKLTHSEGITQAMLSDMSGITETTIRNRQKEICKKFSIKI
jgi:transcription initiation factor TFIIB